MGNLLVEIISSRRILPISGSEFRIDFQVLVLLLLELISYSEMKIQ